MAQPEDAVAAATTAAGGAYLELLDTPDSQADLLADAAPLWLALRRSELDLAFNVGAKEGNVRVLSHHRSRRQSVSQRSQPTSAPRSINNNRRAQDVTENRREQPKQKDNENNSDNN